MLFFLFLKALPGAPIDEIVNGNIRCGFHPFAGIDVECPPEPCIHTETAIWTESVVVTDVYLEKEIVLSTVTETAKKLVFSTTTKTLALESSDRVESVFEYRVAMSATEGPDTQLIVASVKGTTKTEVEEVAENLLRLEDEVFTLFVTELTASETVFFGTTTATSVKKTYSGKTTSTLTFLNF
ncbi:MAG: uncharacterized protein A8A55_1204 [Amphiamblys sp. WSBS2006]|nr:MAG: uncharacterized protein A8A55_1204 [Amphiamblys sp. WSBS2006]